MCIRDRSLLRLAIYEILFEDEIPVSVSINEAVDLAKKYGTAEDAPFAVSYTHLDVYKRQILNGMALHVLLLIERWRINQ